MPGGKVAAGEAPGGLGSAADDYVADELARIVFEVRLSFQLEKRHQSFSNVIRRALGRAAAYLSTVP